MNNVRVVFLAPGQVILEETSVPKPGPGELLIRTRTTLISTGTELTAFRGEFPWGDSAWARWVRYPFTPGYSNVGQVVTLGEGVTGFREGDRVLSHGHHAAWVCAPAASATVLPEAVSDEMAAFGVLGQTTLNGVRLAHLALGETVVIVGLGLLGQLASQYARLSGAFPLLAVDLADGRLALAARLGADHTLNPARTDVVQAVHNLTDGRLAEVVFEVTGSPGVVPLTLKLAARLGRVILLGSSRGPTTVDFHDDVHTRGLRLIGAHTTTAPAYETPYHPWTPARNTALFLQLVMAGRLQIEPLISHRVPWSQAPAVFQMLSEDRTQAMGVILQWDEGNEDQHCHG